MKYSEEAEDKIKAECCPGKPFIVYRLEVKMNYWFSVVEWPH